MSAHTPGPWKIGTETRGYEVCTIFGVPRQPTENGLGQEWVYVYPPRTIDGEWHWADKEEQFANARLIAGAPDLLKEGEAFLGAAEALCDWMNGNDLSADYKDQKPTEFKALCDTMISFRAAISRAKGDNQ